MNIDAPSVPVPLQVAESFAEEEDRAIIAQDLYNLKGSNLLKYHEALVRIARRNLQHTDDFSTGESFWVWYTQPSRSRQVAIQTTQRATMKLRRRRRKRRRRRRRGSEVRGACLVAFELRLYFLATASS